MRIIFQDPAKLWFLLSVPVVLILHLLTLKYRKSMALKFANFEVLIKATKKTFLGIPYAGFLINKTIILLILRLLTLTIISFALAGMTILYLTHASDVDYVLAIDSSSSMSIKDMIPDRITIAKESAQIFVKEVAPDAKIGVVSFATLPKIELDLTHEKNSIKNAINNLGLSRIGGTDIGGAIVTGINLLRHSSKARTIILLTDGQANVGTDVQSAVNFAIQNGIKIFTIGIGTEKGGTYIEELPEIQLQLDEETLNYVANSTGAKYFRTENPNQIKEAYKNIAILSERFVRLDASWYLIFGVILLLVLEWGIINIRYRTAP